MSDDGAPLPLTRQLRELHLRLDPDAPRHMSNGQRKAAIQKLLEGDGNGGETSPDRSAKGGAGTRKSASRAGESREGGSKDSGPREAHGVSLPGQEPTRKPSGKRGTAGKPSASNNAERIWRFLFG